MHPEMNGQTPLDAVRRMITDVREGGVEHATQLAAERTAQHLRNAGAVAWWRASTTPPREDYVKAVRELEEAKAAERGRDRTRVQLVDGTRTGATVRLRGGIS